MTEEKWEEIKEMAQKNFEVLENEVVNLPEDQGGGYKDILVFNGPIGKIKLEFVVKPLVLEKKTLFSKRAGQETKVDYVTSDTEKVNTLFAFKWDDASENWVKMDSAQFEN